MKNLLSISIVFAGIIPLVAGEQKTGSTQQKKAPSPAVISQVDATIADTAKSQKRIEPSAHEILLRHIAVIRELKKRSLEKENKELDRKWDKVFEGKSLDDLKSELKKTVTGNILINLSTQHNYYNALDTNYQVDYFGKPLDEILNVFMKNLKAKYMCVGKNEIPEEQMNKLARKWIENEIKYSHDYYVFYTSTKGTIRFLYDIITEFSNYFSISPSMDMFKMRISNNDKKDYFNSIKDYNDELLKNKPEFAPLDHSDFARQTLVSANLSFLSGANGESSLCFFIENRNVSDNTLNLIKLLLKVILKDDDVVEKRLSLYRKLFNDILFQSGSGATMMQIFIKKSEIDSFVYLSQPGGRIIYDPENPNKFLLISDYLSQYMNPVIPSKIDFQGLNTDIFYEAQSRILMNMNKVMNPDIVKMKVFRSNELSEDKLKLLHKELNQLVQEDIAYYLEHTSKEEREKNKLETLKEYTEKGKVAVH